MGAELARTADAPLVEELQGWCQRTGFSTDDLAMIQPGYTEKDQRMICGLIIIGYTCVAISVLAGAVGAYFAFTAWADVGIVMKLLAGSFSLQMSLSAVLGIGACALGQWNDWWAIPMALSCGFAPVNLLLLSILVGQAERSGDARAMQACACALAGSAVLVVIACVIFASFRPSAKHPKLPKRTKRRRSAPQDPEKAFLEIESTGQSAESTPQSGTDSESQSE